MSKILIVGATSAIAEATAKLWAGRGDTLFLVGRKALRLDAIAADLRVRGATSVHCLASDVCDISTHAALLQATFTAMGGLDVALIAHGSLPDQQACERSVEQTLSEINVNALSVIALSTRLGEQFEAQGQGTLAVISSVAGDRGRQSNYVYGAAKGMLSLFLQGLRNRLSKKGVQVLTIKPGFVDTPMTAAFPKGLLWAQPEQIACGIVKAVDQKKDEVYLPGFWRLIMWLIRHIPESLFKKLSL